MLAHPLGTSILQKFLLEKEGFTFLSRDQDMCTSLFFYFSVHVENAILLDHY